MNTYKISANILCISKTEAISGGINIIKTVLPWKNTVLLRLLSTFIAVILPLFIIGFNLYNWGLRTVRQETVSAMQAQTDFYKTNFEHEIQRIKQMQFAMLNDVNLSALIINPSDDPYYTAMDLNLAQQKIEAIKSSSRYISEVKVMLYGLEKTITSTSILDMRDFEYEFFQSLPLITDGRINYRNGDFFIIGKSVTQWNNDSDLPDFCIQVILSDKEIVSTLRELLVYEGSGSFLYRAGTDLLINSTQDKVVPDEIISSLNSGSGNNQENTFNFKGNRSIVTYSHMKQLELSLVRYAPEGEILKKVQQFKFLFWIFAVTALIIIAVFSFFIYRVIHRPLSRLAGAFDRVDRGDMKVELSHSHKDDFKYLYEKFNKMVGNLNRLIEQVYKQKIHTQKAELKHLQSQINPHFLYNSFFILNSMSRTGQYDKLEVFTQQLGEYFQFVTRNAADEVPLIKEVEHARIYTDIQIMRFSNRIKMVFEELPEDLRQLPVPRLILQPIIENAFVHGLEKKLKDGLLNISFKRFEKRLLIVIEDNVEGLGDSDIENMNRILSNEDESRETTGIINIHRRLQIRLGAGSGLSFSRGEAGGLKVVITLDYQEAQDV